MSVAELLHSNLCLLGYEKEASGSKIILSDETFEHANERAFQSVAHFLLRALDVERSRQTFRHCWPVLDKRQGSVFRQAVVAWLKEIKQSDPDGAGLPLINPALFLSPGGRRFKDLLLALTQFCMLKALKNLDSERPGSELVLERGDGDIQCGTLRAACALSKERFVQLQKTKLVSHNHHQRFADWFSAQYRRLRQSATSLTVELGRLVAVSDLPPELTHRLLQENADQVVPAVYDAAQQHLLALTPALERLRQFCRETDYSWRVADSIVSGAVAESVVDAQTLSTPPAGDAATQSTSELLVDGKLDLVAFFDTFVDRAEHLRQFLTHCLVSELKGLHGTLPPLVREASQLAGDAGLLLAELQTECDAAGRRVDRLLAAEPLPPRPQRPRSVSPPPLLAPRTPNWSLSMAPPPPPGDHPLKHMYRSPAKDGVKLDLELSLDGEMLGSSRFSSLTTVMGSARSPWASPAAGPPCRLSAPSPAGGAGGRVLSRSATPAAGDRSLSAPDRWPDHGGLTPTPGGGELSSCSSLFSPVGGQAGRPPLSPSLGSVSSLADSVAETSRPSGDASRSPVAVGSPSAELVRLRERTSALIRSLTRSPVAAGEPGRSASRGAMQRPAGSGHSSPRPLELATAGGAASLAPSSPQAFELSAAAWQAEKKTESGASSPQTLSAAAWQQGERKLASGASSPRALELTKAAWQEDGKTGSEPSWPRAPELWAADGPVRRRPVSGAGSPSQREACPAAEPTDRRKTSGADSAVNFSQLEDQMAEALALSVFGPGDFNHSLDFSNRESLGGVELSLVQSDDSDCDAAPSCVEPPTEVLIDI